MKNNALIVKEFFKAWNALDIDLIMSFFTEDAVYINIPMDPPNKGKPAIRGFIEGFIGAAQSIEFIVHNQVENADGLIMNERTDKLNFAGKIIELPVMGVFEFNEGKICAWRDYFDMKQFSA